MLNAYSMLVVYCVLQPVVSSAAVFSVLIQNSRQQEQQSLSKLNPPPMDYARDGRAVSDPDCSLASWLSLSPVSAGAPGSQHSVALPGHCRAALPGTGPAALALPGSCPSGAAGSCCALRWHQGAQPAAVHGLLL